MEGLGLVDSGLGLGLVALALNDFHILLNFIRIIFDNQ
jgi:hypothetical protein